MERLLIIINEPTERQQGDFMYYLAKHKNTHMCFFDDEKIDNSPMIKDSEGNLKKLKQVMTILKEPHFMSPRLT